MKVPPLVVIDNTSFEERTAVIPFSVCSTCIHGDKLSTKLMQQNCVRAGCSVNNKEGVLINFCCSECPRFEEKDMPVEHKQALTRAIIKSGFYFGYTFETFALVGPKWKKVMFPSELPNQDTINDINF